MKYVIADSSLFNLPTERHRNYRGMNIFSLSELRSITGTTKRGEFITGTIQAPLFTLTPDERMAIMQASTYVHAVISSRMNRISSLEWDIVPKKKIEDEYYYKIKHLKELYDENGDLKKLDNFLMRHKVRLLLQQELPDLKDDLSNFDASLRRWKKRIKLSDARRTEEIKDWLSEPNLEDEWDDWIKKFGESLLLHGASAIYKEYNDKLLDNFYVLPGGTTFPLRGEKVGSYVAYAQVIVGHFPKIYFQDEVCFTNYLPSAARSYGYVPLDALINKIAEQMLFDQFAAERADGTREPETLISFGSNNPFGGLTNELDVPLPKDEQKRIEDKVNQLRKGAIVTLSGVGTPVIHDISKADTFAAQSDRQDKLLRDVALVFNMTNMEINLAGGEFTSGKETSETQQEIEEGKGTRPIIKKIESIVNKNLLPYRFGTDYIFQYKKGFTDLEQVRLDTQKQQSGTYTKNEIREQRGDDAIIEDGNDTLNQPQQGPIGTELAPVNFKNVG